MAQDLNKKVLNVANKISSNMGTTALKYREKTDCDKSFAVTILGVNQKFTGNVSAEDQTTLITKYSIPATIEEGDPNYYTIKINGAYYVVKQNASFKLYDKVMAYLPNGDWSRMYLDYRNGSNVRIPARFYSEDEPEEGMIENDYWYEIDEEDNLKSVNQYLPNNETGELEWQLLYCIASGIGVGEEIGIHSVRFNSDTNTVTENYNGYNVLMGERNYLENASDTLMTGDTNSGEWVTECIIGGSGNTAESTNNEIVSGTSNYVDDNDKGIVTGYNNDVSGGECGISCGSENNFTNCSDGLMTGYTNTANYASQSLGAGRYNTFSSNNSCGVGNHNTIDADNSITAGTGNRSLYNGLALGEYSEYKSKYRIVVGSGSSNSRANVFGVTYDGKVYAAEYNTSGADYAEYFEWADGNLLKQDRRGYIVSLVGDKIVPADGVYVLGIVSAKPSVCGNAFEEYWHGKYKVDVFGDFILDENGNRQISEDYDPTVEYIPRSKRPEWSPIGLFGRLVVVDNGICTPDQPLMANNGMAVPGNSSLCIPNMRMLKRIDATHIEVLVK